MKTKLIQKSKLKTQKLFILIYLFLISPYSLLPTQCFSQNGVSVNTSGAVADNSAILDISSTSQGLLIPRMTTVERDAILSPALSLLIFNTTTNCFEAYVNGAWYSVSCAGQAPCKWNNSNTFTVTHTAGLVAPITKTITYGQTQTSVSGTSECWITQNLGATVQASSPTDGSEAAGGWYCQFNRSQGYDIADNGTTRTPNTAWNNNIIENSDWVAANDPCNLLLGNGWRLPTASEWDNTMQAMSSGYNEAYNSVLKLHAAGFLDSNYGLLNQRGKVGYYNSSTQSSTTGFNRGTQSVLTSGSCYMTNYNDKAFAFPSRCINP